MKEPPEVIAVAQVCAQRTADPAGGAGDKEFCVWTLDYTSYHFVESPFLLFVDDSTAKIYFYRKGAKNAKKTQSILKIKRLCVNLCVFAPSRCKSLFL